LNIGEKKAAAKIREMKDSGRTKITLVKSVKGQKVSICIKQHKVEKILARWYFFFIGDDSFQYAKEDARHKVQDSFAKALKNLRLANGFTQQQLADKLSVSKVYICRMENGKKYLSISQMDKIAKMMGAEISIVLRGRNKKPPLEN